MPLTLEQTADRTGCGDAPATFGHQAANFRRRAVAVVRTQFNEQRDAVRRIDFVCEIFERGCFSAASALFNRSLDILRWHVGGATSEQRHAQTWIHGGITATKFGGNGDLFAKF